MITEESPSRTCSVPVEGLPAPHRCPWWMQYVLISPLRRLMEPPAALVGPYVQAGMTVLDAGCGFGFASLPLAALVGPSGKVLSVDVEPRAIARLRRRARRAGLADLIDARVCQPRSLGLDDHRGRVDLVAVIHTLHEFEDLPGFLSQVKALLKPSGRLLIVEPKGHVVPADFAAELKACLGAGFREVEPGSIRGRRMTAVLAPPV
jgi:ubiquinone/menaquinone biosynthesis C-methylase UbiE